MPSTEQLASLVAAAESWEGTPFAANSATKGAGVCCHHLAAEIYFEAGWLPRFPVASGSPFAGVAGSRNLIEDELDESPHFTDADPARLCESDPQRVMDELAQPGDQNGR